MKLPLIIFGDNNWQGEEYNRTSDNYRVWVGDFCRADKKNQKQQTNVQNCVEPNTLQFPQTEGSDSIAVPATTLAGWSAMPEATASAIYWHDRRNDASEDICTALSQNLEKGGLLLELPMDF